MDATRPLLRDIARRALRVVRDESDRARPNPGMLSILYERAETAYHLLPRDEQKTLWLAGIERVR